MSDKTKNPEENVGLSGPGLAAFHPKFNSGLENRLWGHYVEGSGNAFFLTKDEFQLAVLTLKAEDVTNLNVKMSDGSYAASVRASWYHNDMFDFALGRATVYVQNGKVVGLYDAYDFDSKAKGVRTTGAEQATKMANDAAGPSAKMFHVCYRLTPAGVCK